MTTRNTDDNITSKEGLEQERDAALTQSQRELADRLNREVDRNSRFRGDTAGTRSRTAADLQRDVDQQNQEIDRKNQAIDLINAENERNAQAAGVFDRTEAAQRQRRLEEAKQQVDDIGLEGASQAVDARATERNHVEALRREREGVLQGPSTTARNLNDEVQQVTAKQRQLEIEGGIARPQAGNATTQKVSTRLGPISVSSPSTADVRDYIQAHPELKDASTSQIQSAKYATERTNLEAKLQDTGLTRNEAVRLQALREVGFYEKPIQKQLAEGAQNFKVAEKEGAVRTADILVPGFWARDWNKLTPKERALNAALDLVIFVPALKAGLKGLKNAGVEATARAIAEGKLEANATSTTGELAERGHVGKSVSREVIRRADEAIKAKSQELEVAEERLADLEKRADLLRKANRPLGDLTDSIKKAKQDAQAERDALKAHEQFLSDHLPKEMVERETIKKLAPAEKAKGLQASESPLEVNERERAAQREAGAKEKSKEGTGGSNLKPSDEPLELKEKGRQPIGDGQSETPLERRAREASEAERAHKRGDGPAGNARPTRPIRARDYTAAITEAERLVREARRAIQRGVNSKDLDAIRDGGRTLRDLGAESGAKQLERAGTAIMEHPEAVLERAKRQQALQEQLRLSEKALRDIEEAAASGERGKRGRKGTLAGSDESPRKGGKGPRNVGVHLPAQDNEPQTQTQPVPKETNTPSTQVRTTVRTGPPPGKDEEKRVETVHITKKDETPKPDEKQGEEQEPKTPTEPKTGTGPTPEPDDPTKPGRDDKPKTRTPTEPEPRTKTPRQPPTRTGTPERPPEPPRIRLRLPNGRELPDGQYPEEVTFKSGFEQIRLNLRTGDRQATLLPRGQRGTPSKTLRVTKTSSTPPPVARYRQGAFDVDVRPDRIDFTRNKYARTRDSTFRRSRRFR